MLNSLVVSLWKTCVRIFLYHNLGLHIAVVISMMYGFSNAYVFIISISLIVIYKKNLHFMTLSVFMLCFIGMYSLYQHNIALIKGEVKVVQVIEKTYQSQYRFRYKNVYVLLYDSKDKYEIGEVYLIDATVIPFPRQTRPFGINLSTYYKGLNTYGTLNMNEIKFVKNTFHIQSLRQYVIEEFKRFESKDVFYAFIFDITKDIESNINWLYLMRVSGLHIFFMIEILRHVLKKQLYHPILPLALSIVFLVLQDFNPSMFRLTLYYSLSFILFTYQVTMERSLKILMTWFFQLLIMPYLIFNIGLMLTYLIVLSIHYIEHIFKSYHRVVRLYVSSIVISCILLPLSHVFVFTQVIVSPLLFGGIFFLLFPFMLLTLLFPILDSYLYTMYQWMMISINSLDRWYVSLHIKAFSEIFLMMLCVLLFYTLKSQKLDIFIKRAFIGVCLIAISAISFKVDGIYFYALDTGQGDSNIIHSKDCTIVIDAFQYVEETLLGLGVKTIDYVFITHDDIDHVKELKRLEDIFMIKHIITNPYTRLDIKNQTFITIPEHITCGDINIHVLGPLKDYKNDNDNSLNIKIDIYDKTILFMGDSSKEVELDLIQAYKDILDVDIIKIGHHGSKTSTHEIFIKEIKANKAIISVGRNNRYLMPHLEVLQTLKEGQLHILRTDTMGTIEVKLTKDNITYRFYEP